MFDIGFWEILLISVLAMIVIGPERLPGAAKTAGRWVGKARRFVEGVKTDVEKEFDVTELKRMVHNQEVQLSELNQKLQNPKILDDELESITSSIYSLEDEDKEEDSVDQIETVEVISGNKEQSTSKADTDDEDGDQSFSNQADTDETGSNEAGDPAQKNT